MQKGSLVFEGTPRALFGSLERVRDYHLDLPDIVQLQYDFEKKYNVQLPFAALSDEEFIKLYKVSLFFLKLFK